MFLWGVQNNGHTFVNWGANFGIGVVQDVLFIQLLKIYVIHVIGIEISRPQLRNIYRILNSIAMSLNNDNNNLINEKENGKQIDEILLSNSNNNDINVVQYLSPTCRISRMKKISEHLVSAKILHQMNDNLSAQCKESNIFTSMLVLLIAIPAAAFAFNAFLSEFILDIILPAISTAVILVNQELFMLSPGIFIIPYVVILGWFLWFFGIVKFSMDRVRKLHSNPTSTAMSYRKVRTLNRWNSIKVDNKINIQRLVYLYLLEINTIILDYFAIAINNIITINIIKNNSQINRFWSNMNKPLQFHGKTQISENENENENVDINETENQKVSENNWNELHLHNLSVTSIDATNDILTEIPFEIQELFHHKHNKQTKYETNIHEFIKQTSFNSNNSNHSNNNNNAVISSINNLKFNSSFNHNSNINNINNSLKKTNSFNFGLQNHLNKQLSFEFNDRYSTNNNNENNNTNESNFDDYNQYEQQYQQLLNIETDCVGLIINENHFISKVIYNYYHNNTNNNYKSNIFDKLYNIYILIRLEKLNYINNNNNNNINNTYNENENENNNNDSQKVFNLKELIRNYSEYVWNEDLEEHFIDFFSNYEYNNNIHNNSNNYNNNSNNNIITENNNERILLTNNEIVLLIQKYPINNHIIYNNQNGINSIDLKNWFKTICKDLNQTK